jgi:SpoVK/Ycf46/Vps4 family AAA+-type ATPase
MDYLLEVARIIDGAAKGNTVKVSAYAEQLARKLREAGDVSAARRIEQALHSTGVPEVAASSVADGGRLPVDNESRMTLADELHIGLEDVQVVLESSLQHRVDEFVRFVLASDQLAASEVGMSPSMLIFGPPGVGKTELAKYVAAQLHLPLLVARSDSLISSFLGSTAKNIRLLFQHAKNRPCVLFLDELDSLAKLRDDQHELGELKRVVVSLLQNVDSLGSETVLLAATNHEHLLDPAVWRRFAYKLRLELPTLPSRIEMMRIFMRGYSLDDDLDAVATVSEGLTGADLKSLCENALRLAVVSGLRDVPSAELFKAVVRIRLSGNYEFSPDSTAQIAKVRDLGPSVFTMKRLATVFGTSESTICRRLNSKRGGGDATKTG